MTDDRRIARLFVVQRELQELWDRIESDEAYGGDLERQAVLEREEATLLRIGRLRRGETEPSGIDCIVEVETSAKPRARKSSHTAHAHGRSAKSESV